MPVSVKLAALNRSWPIAEKRRIVELTMHEGVSVQEIAKQHDLRPTTLSAWRTLYRDGKLAEPAPETNSPKQAFLPVNITNLDSPLPIQMNQMRAQINFPCGTSLRIEADSTDLTALGALFASVLK